MEPDSEPIEIPKLPDHESGLRRMLSDSKGEAYEAFKSLEEARACRDTTVILEGDDGGQIYLAWPVSQVKCSEETLNRLLEDLDRMAWACNEGDGARAYYEVRPVGSSIPGGMGGGMVGAQGWIHEEFRKLGLEKKIREVIEGTRDRIRS